MTPGQPGQTETREFLRTCLFWIIHEMCLISQIIFEFTIKNDNPWQNGSTGRWVLNLHEMKWGKKNTSNVWKPLGSTAAKLLFRDMSCLVLAQRVAKNYGHGKLRRQQIGNDNSKISKWHLFIRLLLLPFQKCAGSCFILWYDKIPGRSPWNCCRVVILERRLSKL